MTSGTQTAPNLHRIEVALAWLGLVGLVALPLLGYHAYTLRRTLRRLVELQIAVQDEQRRWGVNG